MKIVIKSDIDWVKCSPVPDHSSCSPRGIWRHYSWTAGSECGDISRRSPAGFYFSDWISGRNSNWLQRKKFCCQIWRLFSILVEIFLVLWYSLEAHVIRSRFPSKTHTKRYVILGRWPVVTVAELIIYYRFCIHINSILGEVSGGEGGNCRYAKFLAEHRNCIEKSIFKIKTNKYTEKTHRYLVLSKE